MQAPAVLFIIFNRPDTTQQVFNAIKKAAPSQLFVAADGPRNNKPGEKELCEQTRSIINQINWPCELKTFYRHENVGCNIAVTSAINWFFTHVEEGIILEDDCLPHYHFWEYMALLLEQYRDNEKVKMIGANNFQHDIQRGNASYYFSNIPHIWGWATWKRAWLQYDFEIAAHWSKKEASEFISSSFPSPTAIAFWNKMFRYLKEGRPITWDYRLPYSIWKHKGVTVIPNVNLVSNIGFNQQGTNAKDANSPLANKETFPILPLHHPSTIIQNEEADLYYCNHYLANILTNTGVKQTIEEFMPWKLRKKIRSVINKLSGE